VVINTLNEEKNLPRALSSLEKLADEVIVVDMYSGDATIEIAKKFGAKVYLHKPTGYVEPARNFAIGKAEGDYVFVLDADEELPFSLVSKLKKLTEVGNADYYKIPRKNIIFGKWIRHAKWWPDYNIRFFKRGKVVWSDVIHSVPMTKGIGENLAPLEENAILHYNYNSIEQFVERLNRYTSLQAKSLVSGGYSFRWQDLLEKPAREFLDRYFASLGYKDGLHGLTLCLLQAFSELVVYAKVWQTAKFPKKSLVLKEVVNEIKSLELEVNYWQADALVREGGGLLQRIKRKLKI